MLQNRPKLCNKYEKTKGIKYDLLFGERGGKGTK